MHVCVLALQEEGTEVDTSVLVVLFSSITLQLIQEKAAGSTSLGVFLLLLWKADGVFIPLKRKLS